MFAQPRNERVTIDVRYWLLTCRIDIRHDNRVRIVETSTKILKQIMKAAEAMRLYDCHNTPLTCLTSCSQDRTYFYGMVPVIVDYGNSTGFTRLGEAPFNTREPR
jgi:hypothetical protein